MLCPFCHSKETAVRDSRPTEDDASVRRRRQCLHCHARFTTYEHVQLRDMMVIKRNTHKTAFDQEKLTRSIRIATRKRPLDETKINLLVSEIVRELERSGEVNIPSKKIGELVMQALRKTDPVAYVRYASVYQDFRNPSDFARFIQALD